MSEVDRGTLLSEVSPNGNLEAMVEQDERVVFFYLHGEPDGPFRMKSCWVRNLAPAPAGLDRKSMKRGQPPMLPRDACGHPEGAPPPRAEDLRIVWFEEGNAAALLERDQVLAIIPAWSGTESFCGYARDCTRQSPLCWPLEADNALFERIRQAEEFWRSWDEGDAWKPIQEGMLAAYQAQLGPYSNYYAIDGGNWPPKALLRIPKEDRVALVTLGMGIRPQPNVEMYVEDPRPYRRIELGMALDAAFPSEAIMTAAQYLSGQSSYPWNRHSWLGHGHTFPCDALPPSPAGLQFPFVLLVSDSSLPGPVRLPDYRGDPVNLLWMVPITAEERSQAESQGSQTLFQALSRQGNLPVHRPDRAECKPPKRR